MRNYVNNYSRLDLRFGMSFGFFLLGMMGPAVFRLFLAAEGENEEALSAAGIAATLLLIAPPPGCSPSGAVASSTEGSSSEEDGDSSSSSRDGGRFNFCGFDMVE